MALRKANALATVAALLALSTGAQSLHGQEVVQALPPPGSQELSSALQRLAQDGNDVSALLDAGDAALKLGDVPAAIGFFGRAQALVPSNPRISLGLARAYTLSRRPVEALRLYAEAERGGISQQRMAAERGLAFDLVGDARSAQELYRMALAAGEGDAVRRNLALSQAISGDKAGFEATLLPLLEQGDFAAFRTRAFGLAILGETDAALKIARDMMTAQTASRVEPYLRYMTRLTPAQQAAAGALGIFPRTAAIGRDDAQIAEYDPSMARRVNRADAALEPSGAALGSQQSTRATSRNADPRPNSRQQREAARSSATTAATISPASGAAVSRSEELPPLDRSGEVASVAADPATQPVDLGTQPITVPAPLPAPGPPPPQPARQNLEEAFAGFDLANSSPTAPRAGAVDITAIDVPRETDEPKLPVDPPRHWVQVATGQNIDAFGFDWRRISRNSAGELAGKSAFTAPWGEANRLLAGPYASASDAREAATRLKAVGVDSFAFSSARGETIYALHGAEPAPANLAPPVHPSRHWVQVATGKDRKALGFDWRRIARNADGAIDGKGPFVVGWGEANRLLAGPYESEAAARAKVNQLEELGIDSFPFTSEAGEAIDKLG